MYRERKKEYIYIGNLYFSIRKKFQQVLKVLKRKD